MNVKQLCGMIYRDNFPVKIKVGYMEDFSAALDINNAVAMEAYGRFKVDSFRALGEDSYEINIAMTPAQPITED